MKCPYCSKEMKPGYIKSIHMIHWGEEIELGYLPDDIKRLNRTYLLRG